MKSRKHGKGTASLEVVENSGYLVTLGKLPGSGGGIGFLFVCLFVYLVGKSVTYFKLVYAHL